MTSALKFKPALVVFIHQGDPYTYGINSNTLLKFRAEAASQNDNLRDRAPTSVSSVFSVFRFLKMKSDPHRVAENYRHDITGTGSEASQNESIK